LSYVSYPGKDVFSDLSSQDRVWGCRCDSCEVVFIPQKSDLILNSFRYLLPYLFAEGWIFYRWPDVHVCPKCTVQVRKPKKLKKRADK
jgi:hypothetical protein